MYIYVSCSGRKLVIRDEWAGNNTCDWLIIARALNHMYVNFARGPLGVLIHKLVISDIVHYLSAHHLHNLTAITAKTM